MRLPDCLLVALLLGTVNAGAQEATQDPAATPAQPDQEAATPAPAAAEEPLKAPPPDAKATGPSPDSFKPSEEISEDLSVSYPVDI